ncbi:MAG: DUF4230 domain-containing protein [Lachnospiraceae bacterium]|nr:DUF4230 domain-containing protein [Lachnospiraceae bacterium]
MLELLKKNKKIKMLVGALALLVLAVAVIVLAVKMRSKEPEFSVVTESSLKEIIEIDEISTLEYFYNSVATVKEEDGEKVKYYVAYEGTVKLGIVLEEIEITVDENTKEILITIPEVKMRECAVVDESLDFIFEKSKYETETVFMEAEKYCKTDLETKVQAESSLYEIAKENAIASIKALVLPWMEQVAEQYVVTVQ